MGMTSCIHNYYVLIILFSIFFCVSIATEGGVKIAVNQMYNGSPSDRQETDTVPFYEEVSETMAATAQYVNMSPTDSAGDSVLVDNPIYGAEEMNGGGPDDFYTAPDDQPSPLADSEFKY